MASPPLTDVGELPLGVHRAHLSEVLGRFAVGSAQRRAVALRLARIYRLAETSDHLARFVVFGSFVTAKPEPADVDVFLFMEDAFDASHLAGEARLLFDHPIIPLPRPGLARACSGHDASRPWRGRSRRSSSGG